MTRLRIERFSYRFAEQVLNAKLSLKQEVETFLRDPELAFSELSRPTFNALLEERFIAKGWESQPQVFDHETDAAARMDFLKDRVGVEVGFSHASFIGIDLLKFQVASYSGQNVIDAGIYIVTTAAFQRKAKADHGLNWHGSLTFEKVKRYLPLFKSAIQVPVLVLGVDV